MNVRKWQAVIFDLDDTLYPEREFVLSGFQAVAAYTETRLGIPATQGYAELKDLFEKGVRGDTFDRWLAAHNLAPGSLVPRLVQVYRDHEPKLTPFPEVRPLLDSLRHRYRLGIVSDGYLAVQKRKLAALELAHYFDAIVFCDEWGRRGWKPSVNPFRTILQRLAVVPLDSIYVGDNPIKDFVGARQVGMWTVQVCRPGGQYSNLSPPTMQHVPHLTLTSLTELEEFVGTDPILRNPIYS